MAGENSVKIPVTLDMDDLNNSLNKLKNTLNKEFNNISKAVNDSTKDLGKNVGNSFTEIEDKSKRAGKTLKDSMKSASNSAKNDIKGFSNSAGKDLISIGNHARLVGDKLSSIGKTVTKVGATLTATLTAPIAFFTKSAISEVTEFEAQMDKVLAITGASGKEAESIIDQLSAKARELAKVTSYTATEAGQAMEYMSLAGWDVSTSIASLEPILRLAESGAMELGVASDLVTDSWSSMNKSLADIGKNGEGLVKYLNVLVEATTKSNTNLQPLLEAMVDIGPTMATLNIPLEDMVASLGALANQGVKGTQSANALSTIFARLAKPTADIQKSFDELNISIFDSAGKFRGVEAVFSDLRVAFSKLTDEQKLYHATTIAGKHYLSEFQMLINAMGGDFQKLNGDIKDSDNALYKMSLTMKDNTQGNIERFQSALSDLKITIAQKILPIFNDFLEKMTEWFNKLAEMDEDKLKGYLKFAGILALIGPILTSVGSAVSIFGKSISAVGKLTTAKGLEMVAGTTAVGVKMTGIFTTIGKALAFISNPLISMPVLIAGVLVAAKKANDAAIKRVEEGNAKLREHVLGLEKSYESLITTSKNAAEQISNTDLNIFGGDRIFKAQVQGTFTAVENYIEKGVGNINTIMDKMLSEIEILAPNMTTQEKTDFGQYFTDLATTMLKAENITAEQAKILQDRLNEILNIDLKFDFKIDENKALVALEGMGERLNKKLYRDISWDGMWWYGKNDKLNKATNAISHELYDNLDQLNKLEAPAIFETLESVFDTSGLKGENAIRVVEGLGLALSQLDPKKGADVFDMFALKLGMTDENMHNFINNSMAYYKELPEHAQKGMLDMIAEIDNLSPLIEQCFNTGYGGVLDQNAEFWGLMTGQHLNAKEDIAAGLYELSDGLMGWLSTLSNVDITPVTTWLSEMLSTMVKAGQLTEEQAGGLIYNINHALEQLEGVDATAKVTLDLSTDADQKQGVLNELNAITSEPVTMEVLMNLNDAETKHEVVQNIAEQIREDKPQIDVLASIEKARPLLDEIIQKLNVIEANKNKKITITTVEKKQSIFEKIGNAVSDIIGFNLDTAINPLIPSIPTLTTDLNLNAKTPTLDGIMAKATGGIGNIPNFTKATQNINSRQLQKATNQASKDNNNTLANIETVLNLDGNVIARIISDRVDIRNGAKFTANQRRFAH